MLRFYTHNHMRYTNDLLAAWFFTSTQFMHGMQDSQRGIECRLLIFFFQTTSQVVVFKIFNLKILCITQMICFSPNSAKIYKILPLLATTLGNNGLLVSELFTRLNTNMIAMDAGGFIKCEQHCATARRCRNMNTSCRGENNHSSHCFPSLPFLSSSSPCLLLDVFKICIIFFSQYFSSPYIDSEAMSAQMYINSPHNRSAFTEQLLAAIVEVNYTQLSQPKK